jgi:hypothetical protein
MGGESTKTNGQNKCRVVSKICSSKFNFLQRFFMSHSLTLTRIAIAASIVLLSACGGGGSSPAPAAAPPVAVVPATFSTTATVGGVGVPAFTGQSGAAPSVNIVSGDLVALNTTAAVNWKATTNGASLSIVGTNDGTHFSAKIIKPEGGAVTIVATSATDPNVSITVTLNVALPLAKYQGTWRTCFTGYIKPPHKRRQRLVRQMLKA